MRFIGRGRTVAAPQAMSDSAALSGSQGSVLDPIVAIRYRITLDSEQSATIDMVSGIGETRDACLGLVGKYQDRHLADRVFELAWTHSQVLLRQINATEADAQLYGRLASSVIYANSSLRADAAVLSKNRSGQSGLWRYAISGDLPIVLLQIKDPANIELVRQLVQAHAYWRLKGLAVDLVILNEERGGYRQLLQDQIMGCCRGRRGTRDGSTGRNLRAACRSAFRRRPNSAPIGRTHHHHRQSWNAGGTDQPSRLHREANLAGGTDRPSRLYREASLALGANQNLPSRTPACR
jgi:cellobiose phosphorylase